MMSYTNKLVRFPQTAYGAPTRAARFWMKWSKSLYRKIRISRKTGLAQQPKLSTQTESTFFEGVSHAEVGDETLRFDALIALDPSYFLGELIDGRITDKFRVKKSTISGTVEKVEKDFYIGIVVKGECTVRCFHVEAVLALFIDGNQVVSDSLARVRLISMP